MIKSNEIAFTKMHGLGNDFVILNALTQFIEVDQLPIRQLANRHLGIGFDQLLILEPSAHADAFCRIFNADGSEAEQCGNGLRCVARFLHEGKIAAQALRLETQAGVFPVEINDYDHIRVTMGTPIIKEKLIEIQLPNLNPIALSLVSMGNPHAIVKVDTVDTVAVETVSPAISAHGLFSQGINIGFMEVLDAHQARLRTVERGSGETRACGSNACAAACAGMINGWLASTVNIYQAYGALTIEWQGENKPVYMTGPASRVFTGVLRIE